MSTPQRRWHGNPPLALPNMNEAVYAVRAPHGTNNRENE